MDQAEKEALEATKNQKMNRVFYYVWLALSCVILPYLYCTAQIYIYAQTNQPAGYNFPKLSDLWIVAVFIVCFDVTQRVVLAISTPFIRKMMKAQDDPELCEKYTKKSSEALVKLVYYVFIVSWSVSILHGTAWFPWWCGGSTIGSFEGMNEGMPFMEIPSQADTCILIYLSLYTYQLIDLFARGMDRPDFNETLVHHLCAVSLTFGTVFANSRGIGLTIAYLHAISDIWVNVSRICASTVYTVPSVISYVVMMVVWIWSRIVCFGYMVFRMWSRRFPPELAQFDNFCTFEVIFCSVLYGLHLHWTRLLLLMLHRFLKLGSTADLQMQVKKKAH